MPSSRWPIQYKFKGVFIDSNCFGHFFFCLTGLLLVYFSFHFCRDLCGAVYGLLGLCIFGLFVLLVCVFKREIAWNWVGVEGEEDLG